MLTTVTSTTLLAALREDGNDAAWERYVARYRPLLVAFGLRLGLGAEDAEDAAQATLMEFCRGYKDGRYDPGQGRLRGWLFGIARHQVAGQRRRLGRLRAREAAAPHSGFFQELSDAEQESAWEKEWREAVVRQALEEVRQEVQRTTFDAFRLFALDDLPAEEVGARLGITANAVFQAKRRVLRRLREILPLVEDVF